MKVAFRRGETTQYAVHMHRPDGVVVSLPGAGGRWPIPHDLAHFATERALGMAGGIFRSMASGAMFPGMSVVSGRLRHDPKRRSKDVLRVNEKARTIAVAEVMASLVHECVQHGAHRADLLDRARAAWGIVREDPFPYTAEQLRAAVEDLRTLSERWARTRVGQALEVDWPDGLVTQLSRPAGRPKPPGSRRRTRA